jgi:hypothetical protein
MFYPKEESSDVELQNRYLPEIAQMINAILEISRFHEVCHYDKLSENVLKLLVCFSCSLY